LLKEIIAAEAGAVVRITGDAAMATFPTPDRAVAAALRIRDEMGRINLLLKIGIHEGPCLAVTIDDRQDYFGQTVNIASRVQGLAVSHRICATRPVVEYPGSSSILKTSGLEPVRQLASLRGIADELVVYEIP
jgi:class 3 adenylate cyclase